MFIRRIFPPGRVARPFDLVFPNLEFSSKNKGRPKAAQIFLTADG
jgi:hypothetical protein